MCKLAELKRLVKTPRQLQRFDNLRERGARSFPALVGAESKCIYPLATPQATGNNSSGHTRHQRRTRASISLLATCCAQQRKNEHATSGHAVMLPNVLQLLVPLREWTFSKAIQLAEQGGEPLLLLSFVLELLLVELLSRELTTAGSSAFAWLSPRGAAGAGAALATVNGSCGSLPRPQALPLRCRRLWLHLLAGLAEAMAACLA